MKGGITEHGEESQGREEEGRQEAVTSPVRKKGGGRRPLFTFLTTFPAHVPIADHDEDRPRITQISRIQFQDSVRCRVSEIVSDRGFDVRRRRAAARGGK